MEKIKLFLLILGTKLIISLPNYAQDSQNEIDSIIYKSYINEDLKPVILLIKTLENKPANTKNTYLLLKSQYALLYFNSLYKHDDNIYEQYYSEAYQNAQTLKSIKQYSIFTNLILVGLYGIEIGESPLKGLRLGTKLDESLAIASINNKSDPLYWSQKGRSLCNKPAILGGNLSESINSFKKAILLYEKNLNTNKWDYIDTHIQLVIAYLQSEDKLMARKYLNKILNLEPEFKMAHWYLKNKC